MNFKDRLIRAPLRRLSGGYKRLSDSSVSVKMVAIVIVTVLIPSVVITTLGILVANRAQDDRRELIGHPYTLVLQELDRKLAREWSGRIRRYAVTLRRARDPQRRLLDLRVAEEHVEDVVLYEDGGFRRITAEPPFWRLEPPLDHAGLLAAGQLEREKELDAALRAYREAMNGPLEIQLEALLGEARVLTELGQARQAVKALRTVADRFGDVDNGGGLPLAIPVLWRIHEFQREQENPVEATEAARELKRRIQEWRAWLPHDDLEWYWIKLDRFAHEVGKTALAIEPPEVGSPFSILTESEEGRAAILAHVRSLRAGDDFGMASLELSGERAVPIAYCRLPGPDRLAYLVLSRDAFFEDARVLAGELEIPRERLHVRRRPQSDRTERPGTHDDRALIFASLSSPFDDWQVGYEPTPEQVPPELRTLDALRTGGVVWALVVLVLTIVLGILITVRSIVREMHVSRLKTDFVSFVTHELKTPLTAIRMFTETLIMGRVDDEEDVHKCAELIDKEAGRLHRLIDQILEFSQIEQRKFHFNFSACDMSEIVAEAVGIFSEQHPEAILEVNQAQHMSRIRMDRSSMVELILNLLSNAFKYTKRSDKRIVVNLKESIDYVFVEVVDFGIGIPKGEQKRIFKKFYRAEDYLTREVDGTGLGLTFAKYIANVHNGEIRVSSAVNQGSTFTLELRKNEVLAE